MYNMSYSKSNSRRNKTRKQIPWAGWGKQSPNRSQRRNMMRNCGRKCFLGPELSFPVCTKKTCRINPKGVYAAFVRARQWGKKHSAYKGRSRPTMKRRVYTRVAKKANALLKKMGAKR